MKLVVVRQERIICPDLIDNVAKHVESEMYFTTIYLSLEQEDNKKEEINKTFTHRKLIFPDMYYKICIMFTKRR